MLDVRESDFEPNRATVDQFLSYGEVFKSSSSVDLDKIKKV